MKSGEGVQCVVAKRVDCSTSRERGEGGHHDSEVSFDGVVFYGERSAGRGGPFGHAETLLDLP